MDKSWSDFLEKYGLLEIVLKLAKDNELILRPFQFPLKPRLAIISPECYKEGSDGLAFSQKKGSSEIKVALSNIFKSLKACHRISPLEYDQIMEKKLFSLDQWALNGIILFNIIPDIGSRIIEGLSKEFPDLIFILLGTGHRQKIEQYIKGNKVIKECHPGTKGNIFAETKIWNEIPDDISFNVLSKIYYTVQEGKLDRELTDAPEINGHYGTDRIFLFTDGSYARSKAHYGIIIADQANLESQYQFINGEIKSIDRDFKEIAATNQRAELTAILVAFQYLLDTVPSNKKIFIISDSKYAIGCICNWFEKWELNKVYIIHKNIDLIKRANEMYKELRDRNFMQILHFKGHGKEPDPFSLEHFLWYGNKMADLLSRVSI